MAEDTTETTKTADPATVSQETADTTAATTESQETAPTSGAPVDTTPTSQTGDGGEPDTATDVVPDFLLPDRAYQVLKWVALIALPALAVFVQTVGTTAGWDATGITVTVLNAAGLLVGALIGVSQIKAER